MTGTGSRASIIGPALAIGGLCLLGLIGLVIAAIIVLSIIPTYTQSNAVEGMGEEYRMDQLILRAFTDSSYAANKSIANSSDLSLACTKAMQSGGDASFYACVVATIRAANGTPLANDTMRRKRYTASLVLISDGVAYLQQISIASINQLIASQTRFSTTAAYSSSMSAG
ncbi:unnamed protein product [Didymodactylos carnosus]|uniref:Uncharacterized protein n=1 Tax=Didymodactylos carnosus TaxID=1234261 RepID=A0A814DPY7_9BILA|nr:unnamed protein product [Didymodactylos carnosus]CAF3730826.1 unnamed protein product [Didymodactylos carnosus]